jgi:hypothetical protein
MRANAMANKADGNLSVLRRVLKAPDLPPEVRAYLTRIPRAIAARIDPAKLPGTDLARFSASIDQAKLYPRLAELLAKHPELRRYLAGPVGVLARIEAGNQPRISEPATKADSGQIVRTGRVQRRKPSIQKERVLSVLAEADKQNELSDQLKPLEVRRIVKRYWSKRYRDEKMPSARTIDRAYKSYWAKRTGKMNLAYAEAP